MQRTSTASSYRPLGDYLTRLAGAGQSRVVLSFAQLEGEILERRLPPTARHRRDWWRNAGTQGHAWYGWLRAGWFVADVSVATETVTFTRGDEG